MDIFSLFFFLFFFLSRLRPACRFSLSALPASVIVISAIVIAPSVIIIIIIIIPPIPRLRPSLLLLPNRPLLLLLAQLLRILIPLPPQPDIISTDGNDARTEEIHREALIAQLLLLVGAHLALLDGVLARVVRLRVLVQAVGGGDGGDGRQPGRQRDVLPAVFFLLRFFRGGVVAQIFFFGLLRVVVAFVAAGGMAEAFAVFLALVRSAARGVGVGIGVGVGLVVVSALELTCAD